MSYNKKGSLIKELECVGYLIAMFFFFFYLIVYTHHFLTCFFVCLVRPVPPGAATLRSARAIFNIHVVIVRHYFI